VEDEIEREKERCASCMQAWAQTCIHDHTHTHTHTHTKVHASMGTDVHT